MPLVNVNTFSPPRPEVYRTVETGGRRVQVRRSAREKVFGKFYGEKAARNHYEEKTRRRKRRWISLDRLEFSEFNPRVSKNRQSLNADFFNLTFIRVNLLAKVAFSALRKTPRGLYISS